jgi:hypothetical protein
VELTRSLHRPGQSCHPALRRDARDQGIDNLSAAVSAVLVCPYQQAVLDDIGGEDRRRN